MFGKHIWKKLFELPDRREPSIRWQRSLRFLGKVASSTMLGRSVRR